MSTIAQQRWLLRAERCHLLAKLLPEAESILTFYAGVLQFQGSVLKHRAAALVANRSFLEQLNSFDTREWLPDLLTLVRQSGPTALASRAKQLQNADCCDEFNAIKLELAEQPYEIDDFFRRACLQPLAEHLQLQMNPSSNTAGARCPVCDGLPQLSIIRPEGDGGARWLQCSFCLKEWMFRRVICPSCGEEDKEKLPRYSAEECSHVYVSACDVCKRYLKSVDMTIEGRAEPLVDEVALAALDVWAAAHGYQKIIPNLMGF